MRKTWIWIVVLLLLFSGCGTPEGPVVPSREVVLPTVDPSAAMAAPSSEETGPAAASAAQPGGEDPAPAETRIAPTEPPPTAPDPTVSAPSIHFEIQPAPNAPRPGETSPTEPDVTLTPGAPDATAEPPAPTEPPATEPAPTRPAPTEPPVTSPTTGTPDPERPDNGEAPTTEDLQILYVGPYSGPFYEDGSDEEVSSVASLLLENISDRHLEYAELVLYVGGKEAVFQISDLPAGERVLALEINRLQIRPEQDATLAKDKTVLRFVPQEEPPALDFRSEGGNLIVTNVGTSAFRSVEIRYKLRRDKETLLGGLSYRVRVGTLGPGESRTVAAGHYDPDNCTIVFVKVT